MSLGIEKIKEVTKDAIAFADKLEDKLADGRLSWTEGISLAVSTAPDVFEAAINAAEIKAEFQDLTADEKQELADYIADELDLENDKVEAVAEAAIDLLLALDNLVQTVKASR